MKKDNVNTTMPLNWEKVFKVIPMLLCTFIGEAMKVIVSINVNKIHITVGFFLKMVSTRLYAPMIINAKREVCDIILPDGHNTPCR